MESVRAVPAAQVCVAVCGTLNVKEVAVPVSAALPVVSVPNVVPPQLSVIGFSVYVRELFVASHSVTGIVVPTAPFIVTADCKTGLKAHETAVPPLI